MNKDLCKYAFTLLLIIALASCGPGSSTEGNPMDAAGPGPCYDQSLVVYMKEEFKILPVFSSKGQQVFDELEKETGLSYEFHNGHYNNDSINKTCRLLAIDAKTTNFKKFIQLDTSGYIDQMMRLVFDTYLNECKNTHDYEEVILRFELGKNDSYDELLSEKQYYLSTFKKNLN